MSEFKHIDKCLEWQAQNAAKVKAFDEKYPKACKICGGAGEVTYSENHGPTGENWPESMTDVCPTCVENGICPLCGTVTLHEVDNGADLDWRCDECHWSEQSPTKIVRPWEFDGDCECYAKWIDGQMKAHEDFMDQKENQFIDEHGL